MFSYGYAFYAMRVQVKIWTLKEASVCNYLGLEQIALFSFILSNSAFLFVRNLVKHRVLQEDQTPKQNQLPKCDTLIGLDKISESFTNAYSPLFLYAMSTCLYKFKNVILQEPPAVYYAINFIVAVDITLQALYATMTTFVSPKHGPKIWVRYAPKIYIIGAIIIRLGSTSLVFCTIMYFTLNPEIDCSQAYYFNFFLFYACLCIGNLVNFFTMIYPRMRHY
jgi:hypothetical protein